MNTANWKTTAAGLLSAFLGIVGPITAYLATTNNPKATEIAAALTCAGAIARIWIGMLQNDAQPSLGTTTTTATTVSTPAVPASTVTKISALVLASLLIVPMVACKVVSTNPPTAPGVSALNVLYMVQADVLALQNAEIAAVKAGLIDTATDAKIQTALKQEAVDATALGVAISSTATATTVQAKVNALLVDLQNDVTSGALGIKDGNTKATITASIAATELAINGIMTAYNAGK